MYNNVYIIMCKYDYGLFEMWLFYTNNKIKFYKITSKYYIIYYNIPIGTVAIHTKMYLIYYL